MTNRTASPWPEEYRRNLERKRSYRFAALTWGTRGDVKPFAALGAELVRRGHEVVVAAREPYRRLIEEQGLEFFAMPDDGTDQLMHALAESSAMLSALVICSSYSRRLTPVQFRQFWEATEGADAILTKSVSTMPALHIAERRGVPLFLWHNDPGFLPTESFCLAGDRIEDKGKRFNRFMGRFMLVPMGYSIWDKVNRWRWSQRMPLDVFSKWSDPSYFAQFPTFITWSPHLLDRPSDWPEWFVQTGYMRLPWKGSIGKQLRDFMKAGPPPVYIGFGSWGVHDKQAVTEALLESLRITGNRGILLRSTIDGRSEFPPSIYVEEELPHDWLLPQLKAAVHHGGSGTVGAVTSAGIPSIIIPAFTGQACWASIVKEKGIGATLDRHEITVEKLVAALREIDRPEVRERARTLGALARKDGGEVQAADEVEYRLKEAVEGAKIRLVRPIGEAFPSFPSGGLDAKRRPPLKPIEGLGVVEGEENKPEGVKEE
jgi:sterol 3beta-glucosyltransferase